MTYEKAAQAAYLCWLATESVEAKRLSDFFSRLPPCEKMDHIESSMLKVVLKQGLREIGI